MVDQPEAPERRPITHGMVEVLGAARWTARTLAWAGLRFHEAELRERSPITGLADHHLAVPFCHPDDASDGKADAIFRVRPIPGWRFVRSRSGAWVMEKVA